MDAASPTSVPRGTLVYDGDCRFCCLWVERWRARAGTNVIFVPYQEAEIPGLRREDCEQAVQWIGADGVRDSGAGAVFRLMADGSWMRGLPLKAYLAMPIFAAIASGGYRLVANNRSFFSWLTWLFWGRDVRRPTFAVATRVFLSLLGLIYLLAFLDYLAQMPGLIGDRGITPAKTLFENAGAVLSGFERWQLPSLLWFGASERAIGLWCGAGILASLAVVFGLARGPALFACWAIYLSLCVAGGVFYQFQWDILLLETGFLSLFLASWRLRPTTSANPNPFARFLLLWLLFRLMVSSGLAKLTSGDPTWWPDLSALDFHFFTQPLPTPMAWSADQLPIQILQGCTLVMFFIELVLPFTMFGPRRLRLVSFFGLVLLQVLIALTGNYGFFNLLTLLLCVLLLDDSIFAKLRMRPNPGAGFLPSALLYPAGAVLIVLSLVPFLSVLRGAIPLPQPLVDLHTMIAPYRTINGYGLFAVMTTSRKEILVQGSHDGYDWKTYSFRYKPGDPRRAPPVIAPRMPRLDWQMWFAALGPIQQSPWFVSFAQRLLEAEPAVLNLLESDPFEGQRPRFVRAVLDDYRFSTPIEKKESGLWWKAEPAAIYLNEVSLGPGR